MSLKNAHILIIDDDEDVLIALRLLLKSQVAGVVTARNPNQINSLMSEQKFDIVILDMNFNGLVHTGNEGLYWLGKVREKDPGASVILITAYGDIDLAIRSLKQGASDFLVKPWQNEKLLEAVREAAAKKGRKTRAPKASGDTRIVGQSEAMEDVFTKVRKVAPTDANILILGENGTGKDLVARSIHENSLRRKGPFVKVDVGSLTDTLFESELFGYRKGAFTDAREDRQGRFEAAQGGTLFLDEIGNISLRQQARLLTVLQNRQVTPLGSNAAIPVDIRLICATNKRMEELSDEDTFRRDLIYRINTVDILIPPLRERGDDRRLLARHFAEEYAEKYGKGPFSFEPEFMHKLDAHSFPGNVRELQYALERAVIMSEDTVLRAKDLVFSAMEKEEVSKSEPRTTNLEALERNTILRVIEKNGGNISKSARELGLTRAALYRRLEKYDL